MTKIARSAAVSPATADPQVVLDLLPDPLLLVSSDRRISYANQAAEEFFHAGRPTLARLDLDMLFGFASPIVAAIGRILAGGSAVNERDIVIDTPRLATPRLVDVQALPAEPAFDGVLLVLQQRTAAERIEQQLAHRGAARSVSGLAEMLAHEIKNPLAGIRGAAQLIEAGADPETRQLTQLICDETDRVRRLVERFEEFSDDRPITKRPVNIHSVLSHVARVIAAGPGAGLQIIERYDPSLPEVPGDRDRLIQAALNLAKNAAESLSSRRAGGRIVLGTAYRTGIRLADRGSSSRQSLPLVVTIEDNGPGIPDEIRPYLFEPFVSSKAGGKGLGLALVAKIIGDHGGIIECDSDASRTIFRIHLPVIEAADDRPARKSPASAPGNSHVPTR